MSKRTKRQRSKNVARGQGSRRLNSLRLPTTLRSGVGISSKTPLRSSISERSIVKSSYKSPLRTIAKSTKRARSSSSSRSPISSRITRKRVQINTPENEVLEYTLGSSELEWKKLSPIRGIPKCKHPKDEYDFPCKMKRTIFKNKKSYDKYMKLKSQRNESTGYKSRSEHYDDVESALMTEGYTLLRK